MFSVPLDAGKTALGSTGVITLFAVGLVIAPCQLTCPWVKQTGRRELLADCLLVYLSFMDCRAKVFEQPPFFANTPYIYAPFEMPEVHLKEHWRKSPSWYHTSWRTMPTSKRRGREWGRA